MVSSMCQLCSKGWSIYWCLICISCFSVFGLYLVCVCIHDITQLLPLHSGYHAPLDIYSNLKHIHNNLLPHGQTVNLCVGKEWYRFPSSFFLPSQDWNLFFLKSEFRGQLPKYFEAPPPEGSRVIPASMNDMSLEEISSYVSCM